MKILVTGGCGMLGREIISRLSPKHETLAADLPEWDITDGEDFTSRCLDFAPDVIIHAAAMTNVDGCEKAALEAGRINEDGSRNVAIAAVAAGARLIAISTDYVFGACPPSKNWAWSETDLPHPTSVYGATKLAGERMISMIQPAAVILRIAWLYGHGGPSFVHTMARLGSEEGEALKVVNDQRGNPTSTKVVVDVIEFILDKPELTGVVHATCENQCSWYDFAVEIFKLLKLKREVVPCTTQEYPRPAIRPVNSALKKSVLNRLGFRTPDWRTALAEFIEKEFFSK